MVLHRVLPPPRQSEPPRWNEQDELEYIAQGEPLEDRLNNFQFPRAFGHPRHTALQVVPFVFVVWIFHPLSQMITEAFESAKTSIGVKRPQ
jgi:hypothetical protein